jgi:broad specificity phosphatase PhoE
MREHHPEQYTARMDDKLNYRYPGVGGESCTRHTQGSQPPRTSRQGPRQAWQGPRQVGLTCYSRVRAAASAWTDADLVLRVQESILALEQRRGNSVIVCDRAVGRVLLGYFQGTQPDRLPFLEIFPGVVEL